MSTYRHFPQPAHFSVLVLKYPPKFQIENNGAWQDIIRRNAYMKTPTPKKNSWKKHSQTWPFKRLKLHHHPEKGQISRHYQSLGGDSVRGAASATARKFNLPKSAGPGYVKKYDREIRDGVASRANRRSTGRPKKLNADMEAKIIDAWADDDTRTYREVGEDLGIPRSTLYTWVVQRGLRRLRA